MKTIQTEQGQVEYLNSGDWIENLTALEYNNKKWTLFKYNPIHFIDVIQDNEDELVLLNNEAIFDQMLSGFLKDNDILTTINFS
jgi:hypothetical protein